jgi:outer membrane protein assembly factor BamB
MMMAQVVLAIFSLVNAGPWSQFHHDPQHTGRSTAIGPETAKLRWKLLVGGYLSSSPVVGPGDTIYIGNSDGVLEAITPGGKKQWEFKSQGFIRSTPAVSPDRVVYFGSNDNHFYAVTSTGDSLWCFDALQQVASSPSINNAVYVGSAATVYAFSFRGSEQWEYPSGPVKSSPAIDEGGNSVYFQNYWQEPLGVYCLNAANGSKRWLVPTGGGSSSPAISPGGTIYVGSDNDTLYAFSAAGSLLWSFGSGAKIESSPAIGFDGTVYVGSNDSCLYALGPDGTEKWRFKTGGPVKSSPAIDRHNTVFVGSFDSYLYAVNSDGAEQWHYSTGGPIDASPAIGSDGTIYIGSWDGYLYAIGPGQGVAEDGSGNREAGDRLVRATPDPFNKQTRIGYYLSRSETAVLEVFDRSGRLVRSFTGRARGPGYFEVVWDGRDGEGKRVASGIYFFSLRTSRGTLSQKITCFNE